MRLVKRMYSQGRGISWRSLMGRIRRCYVTRLISRLGR